MKINLISAFLTGMETFKMNPPLPSTVFVYCVIIEALNRQAWKTITLKTTLNGISNSTNLRPYLVRDAIEQLVELELISIQVDINTLPVRQQFAIVVLPNERNGADSEGNKIHENNDMHSMQCKQAGSHSRQPCNEASKHCNGVTDLPPNSLEANPTSKFNFNSKGDDTNNEYPETSGESLEYSNKGLHSGRSDLQQEGNQNNNELREEDIPEFARRVREEFAKFSQ